MIDKRALSVAVILLAVFLAGGFCGWWLGRTGQVEPLETPRAGGRRPASAQKEFMLNEFTRKLDLTEEQRARFSKIMDQWSEEVEKANREHIRSKEAVFTKFAPLLRTNLTSGQQKAYDRMTDQMERRHRRAQKNQ